MKKQINIIIILLFINIAAYASNINFNSGYTTLSMQEGNKKVSLSNSAYVQIDDLEITAEQITLSGEDYKYVECVENITFYDRENEITLKCSSLKYNQETQVLVINGWNEINDTKNSIYATSSYLEYNLDAMTLDLMIEVKLLHDSDDKIMKCNSDTLRFDLDNNILSLLGSSKVDWDSNTYQANAMTINLNNNDISMDGNIEANIYTN
ncbi:MAG: hypothetical protein ACPKM0_04480 [Pleomorphochaeta sp.]